MRMDFLLFRVSLIPRRDLPLFEGQPETNSRKNRRIVDAILRKPEATYRNTAYTFSNLVQRNNLIVGRLSRPAPRLGSIVDEETGDLVDYEFPESAWTHFLYVGDGVQIVAIARKPNFFAGKDFSLGTIFGNVLDAGLSDDPYFSAVEPISRKTDFWATLKRAQSIQYLRLDLIPPNLFGGSLELLELLRRLRDTWNVQRYTQMFLPKPGGMHIPEEDLEAPVNYISRGGGTYKARAIVDGRVEHISSKTSIESIPVDDPYEFLRTTARPFADELAAEIAQIDTAEEPTSKD